MGNGAREATLQIQGAPRKVGRMMGHLGDFFEVEKAEAEEVKNNTKRGSKEGGFDMMTQLKQMARIRPLRAKYQKGGKWIIQSIRKI